MKRLMILLLLVVLCSLSVSAQNEKEKSAWVDLQLTQLVGVNDWSSVDYVNNGLPRASLTELRGVLNIRLGNSNLGVFGDVGLGLMPAPKMKSFDLGQMEMPHNGTKYYLREMLSETGSSSTSAHFKATAGLFFTIQSGDKLRIVPHLGIGFMTMSKKSYDVLLKEDGSNLQYQAMYAWNSNEFGETKAPTPGYLTGRLNAKYKVAEKMSLMFGLEYMWVFSKLDYTAKFTNTFNQNIERNVLIKGEKMSMIGLSVGLSFM